MIKNDDQSFYIAIVGQKLHIDYFGLEDSISHRQKNYLMPDTLGDNLNLIILSKFILEKVKDFEKDVGNFIEKVCVITDAKYDQFSLSLKNKYDSDQIKETDVARLISSYISFSGLGVLNISLFSNIFSNSFLACFKLPCSSNRLL